VRIGEGAVRTRLKELPRKEYLMRRVCGEQHTSTSAKGADGFVAVVSESCVGTHAEKKMAVRPEA
jgi:hypothetical protein